MAKRDTLEMVELLNAQAARLSAVADTLRLATNEYANAAGVLDLLTSVVEEANDKIAGVAAKLERAHG